MQKGSTFHILLHLKTVMRDMKSTSALLYLLILIQIRRILYHSIKPYDKTSLSKGRADGIWKSCACGRVRRFRGAPHAAKSGIQLQVRFCCLIFTFESPALLARGESRSTFTERLLSYRTGLPAQRAGAF